ncbi:pimeloyl-ACP methyl ester carboxylesterase [Antricoccus suffuscus]|uniref:Pimeloyl-ACP methyl ester carboxylesterase n=1 Tax=Antricoccus suffuscus TaxID=1629062 RepID=A0A2T0YYU1_9ACTN|nr:alpha/beta hydrolase [Antricoccus suffuscus]PRZ29267.1 pimeloyl-ACP methyl ester carboxylesterase [Antricoccus suffuscus]
MVAAPSLKYLKSPGVTSPASIEYAEFGSGVPVTLFMHGLGGGIDDTRPLASGVPGTKVFMHARSHGGSSDAAAGVTYDDLAADAWQVAETVGATQIFGVSLGSATLLRMLAQQPMHFDAIGVYLPAAVTEPRPSSPTTRLLLSGMAHEELRRAVIDLIGLDMPADRRTRPDAQRWLATRADRLLRDGISDLLHVVESEAPIASPAQLERVLAPSIVIGAEGDPTHFVQTAHQLADVLPDATLRIFTESAPLWTARAEVRAAVTSVLGRAA